MRILGKEFRQAPERVAGLADIVAVSVGGSSACAMTSKGIILCWGQDKGSGVLGRGTHDDSKIPQRVLREDQSGPLEGARSITQGEHHACALLQNGAVCWGANERGQLGNGNVDKSAHNPRLLPFSVQELNSDVIKSAALIVAGPYNTSLVANGRIYYWGESWDYDRNDKATPTVVADLPPNISRVALQEAYGCAIVNERMKCWSGARMDSGNFLVSISSSFSEKVSYLSVTQQGGCAVVSNGPVRCWKEIVDSHSLRHSGEIRTITPPEQAIEVTGDLFGACVVTDADKVYCWSGVSENGASVNAQISPIEVLLK
jgi:alpha-tubulin suppressor-like RCC1 family protein